MHGISPLSIIPLRAAASDKSEIVSQILFGEHFEILDKDLPWLKVKLAWDGYEGWIDHKQLIPISEYMAEQLSSNPQPVALSNGFVESTNGQRFPILFGSTLPFLNHEALFQLSPLHTYTYYKGIANSFKSAPTNQKIREYALQYLHSPYLWGGRGTFGIDCSGFTQNVMKAIGVKIKRDAYQQETQGSVVASVEQAELGDLAFFYTKDPKKVTHVGIVLENQQIIHAHGKVRIDRLQKMGIYNEEINAYTHSFYSLKRFI